MFSQLFPRRNICHFSCEIKIERMSCYRISRSPVNSFLSTLTECSICLLFFSSEEEEREGTKKEDEEEKRRRRRITQRTKPEEKKRDFSLPFSSFSFYRVLQILSHTQQNDKTEQ